MPAFLAALAGGMHVRDAATEANVSPSVVYERRVIDKAFAKAWKKARQIGGQELEAEAMRRAYHGTEKPVYQGKALVGKIREYSDTLLIFLLKGRFPARYRDNHKHEHSGPGGGPIVNVVMPDNGRDDHASPAASAGEVPGNAG